MAVHVEKIGIDQLVESSHPEGKIVEEFSLR